MAYSLTKIAIVDTKPSTGVGVKIPFSDKSVFTTVYSTKEQTKYNIINYLLTDPKERVFNPTFGAGIRSNLFEHITYKSLEEIKISISNKLEKNFPNVRVDDATVTADPDTNTINISFSYTILNTKESDEINIAVQQ